VFLLCFGVSWCVSVAFWCVLACFGVSWCVSVDFWCVLVCFYYVSVLDNTTCTTCATRTQIHQVLLEEKSLQRYYLCKERQEDIHSSIRDKKKSRIHTTIQKSNKCRFEGVFT
jgi:hypothetical protein